MAIGDNQQMKDLFSFNPQKNLKGLFGDYTEYDPYGTLNPEQRQLTKALGPQLTQDATRPYTDYLYNGNLSAPIDQGTQDVVSNANRLNAVAGNTFQRLGSYDPNQVNQDFNTEVQDPTFDNFKRNIEPYLGEELPSFGTARANVVARSLNDLQNNLSTQRFTAQQTAKQTALNALSGANTYNQGAAAIQDIPRVIKQAGLDSQYNNFLQANQQKANSLQQALAFLGLSTGSIYTPPSPIDKIASLGKSAAQIAAASGGA